MNRRELDQNNVRVLRRVASKLVDKPNPRPSEQDGADIINDAVDKMIAKLVSDD